MTDNTHFPDRVWLYPNGDLCRREPIYKWEAQSYVRSDLYDTERSAKSPTLVADAICRLAAENNRLQVDIDQLRNALSDLVECNERWNASVQKVIGRVPNWTDGYLDRARAILKETCRDR